MRKINIGYMISGLGPYGPPNVMYNIIKYLDRDIFNIYIITLHKKNKGFDETRFKKLGCKVINLGTSKIDIFFYDINKLKKIIIDNDINILHSHCVLSTYLISKLDSVYKITTVHCDFREVFKLTRGNFKGKIMERIYLNSLKNLDIKICCGKGIKRKINRYLNMKMNVIQNGIDLENFDINGNKEKIKDKLNLEKNFKYFIFVGRFNKIKNPYIVAKAFDELKLKKFKLVLLGNGLNNDIEKNKIQALNNEDIIFPGRVNNVNEYLSASDYFISASSFEGLPNSVLEACAMGLPCILSDIEPHKEIIELQSNSGLLYKLGSKEDLKNKIREILEINYKEYSQNSLKIVKNYLNAKNMSKNYEKVYKKSIEKF